MIKESLAGLSPAQLVLARLALGAAVLLSVAAVRRVGLPRGATVWAHLAAAALFSNVIPFLCSPTANAARARASPVSWSVRPHCSP